ncbi:hypothetical protein ACFL6U_10975 [Planctomycetota bacterium]
MFVSITHRKLALVLILCVASCGLAGRKVSISGMQEDPKVAFAVTDLQAALGGVGCRLVNENADLRIVFDTLDIGMGPQAFRIRKEGKQVIRVIGGDPLGAMYGGLELAEMITLGGGLNSIQEKARKPYLLRRGIKFNIPLDGRAPSYDDTGTSAQRNIAHMWDWTFWEDYLNFLARNRYNLLTLWVTHPYPGWVKLPRYPEVGYDDVCVINRPVDMNDSRHWEDLDVYDVYKFKVIKKISLNDKIAFWTRVFNLAEDRGIEIYLFHWNIYTFGAEGRHGINDDADNPNTVAYMRYAIGEFLKTYPQVDGIGVTAGEHVDEKRVKNAGGIEQWLWQTYGQGVMDTKRADPHRKLRFIFRRHQASLSKITEAFKDFNGPFDTAHKYARARLYCTTTSPRLDMEYRKDLETYKIPCWLNLRNDDLFVFRWGDADYVREFLQNLPRDVMGPDTGFYMGGDGYVYGREFISKDPALSGQMEVDKHWYRLMLWGRLGYDVTLSRDYFETRLTHHFPKVNTPLLYDTWAAASQVVPQVNRFFWRGNDNRFAPEACAYFNGLITVDKFFRYGPLDGTGILSVEDYAETINENKPVNGLTPMDVADNLDALAAKTLAAVNKRRPQAQGNNELLATLTDMEAVAYLGRYYADKFRGAADLAVFRANKKQTRYHGQAVAHLTNAVAEWESYAKVSTRQYHPQLLARTYYMDWWMLLDEVKLEVENVRAEAE